MFGFSFGEIALILLVALLFIGPKKIPELAKGMGKGIRDFQKALKGLEDESNTKEIDSNTTHKQS